MGMRVYTVWRATPAARATCRRGIPRRTAASELMDDVERSWDHLWEVAGQVGQEAYTPRQRKTAHGLLAKILDPSVEEHERSLAQDHLDSIIAKSTLSHRTKQRLRTKLSNIKALPSSPTQQALT